MPLRVCAETIFSFQIQTIPHIALLKCIQILVALFQRRKLDTKIHPYMCNARKWPS